jgi:outer membrane protein TolC
LLAVPAVAAAAELTLDQAIDATLRAAPSLETARAQLSQAQARTKQAWSLLLPTLDSTLTFTHWDQEVAFSGPSPDGQGTARIVIQNQDQWDAQNTARVSLFNYTALPLLRNAYAAVELEELSIAGARRALAFEAASAYVQILAAKRSVELAAAAQAFYTEHHAAQARRLARGVGDKLGVIRAQQELQSAGHRAADAQRAVTFAKESLALLMARPDIDFEVAASPALPPLPDPGAAPGDALVDQALSQREDVRLAETSTELADRNIEVEWSEFVPKFDLTFNHTWSNAAGFAGLNNRWFVVVTATWNIFDGGLRYGRLDEKRAALSEALHRVEETRLRARAEVLAARQALQDSTARLAQANESVALAKEAQDAAQKLFDGGLVDYLRLFDARYALESAELAVLNGQVQVELAQLRLLQALGIHIGPR